MLIEEILVALETASSWGRPCQQHRCCEAPDLRGALPGGDPAMELNSCFIRVLNISLCWLLCWCALFFSRGVGTMLDWS